MDKVITISLIITAIHVSTLPGMIFQKVPKMYDKFLLKQDTKSLLNYLFLLRKPLYECLICMGGLWTLILYPILYQCIEINTIFVALQVIGLNAIISILISKLYD
jgi:hypothetical protein